MRGQQSITNDQCWKELQSVYTTYLFLLLSLLAGLFLGLLLGLLLLLTLEGGKELGKERGALGALLLLRVSSRLGLDGLPSIQRGK